MLFAFRVTIKFFLNIIFEIISVLTLFNSFKVLIILLYYLDIYQNYVY